MKGGLDGEGLPEPARKAAEDDGDEEDLETLS
jgi:hypothetical protein